MTEQQSQKRGLRSESQKESEARDAYAPIAATSPAGGAFSDQKPEADTDQDLALSLEEKRLREERERNS